MAFFMSCRKGVFEAEAEVEDLVLDRVSPICPPVYSWAHMEVMWYAFLEKLFVKVAVDFIEEILCAAINYKVNLARSDKVSHVDYRIVFPVFRILLIFSKPFGKFPILRKRAEIHAT